MGWVRGWSRLADMCAATHRAAGLTFGALGGSLPCIRERIYCGDEVICQPEIRLTSEELFFAQEIHASKMLGLVPGIITQ